MPVSLDDSYYFSFSRYPPDAPGGALTIKLGVLRIFDSWTYLGIITYLY